MKTPPYRVETRRAVLRCWRPDDAALLKDAIDSSLDHLRRRLPWAQDEPQPLEAKAAMLDAFRARFEAGEDYVYGIFTRDESEVLGGTGLHTRLGGDTLEIGYWIRESATGQGLAAEVAAALTRVALFVSAAGRVEIRVDPENTISARVASGLGFHEQGVLPGVLPPLAPGGSRRAAIVFVMDADRFPGSRADALSGEIRAFDRAGAPVAVPPAPSRPR